MHNDHPSPPPPPFVAATYMMMVADPTYVSYTHYHPSGKLGGITWLRRWFILDGSKLYYVREGGSDPGAGRSVRSLYANHEHNDDAMMTMYICIQNTHSVGVLVVH